VRHVPHLFVAGPWPEGAIPIDESQLHHLTRVLRKRSGSDVTYTDGRGTVGTGTLQEAAIERGPESHLDRSRTVRAVVAPPADRERQRFTVEKLAELGVARLSWLDSARGQGRSPRLDRAEAWARSALEQSRGAWLMAIDPAPVGLADLGSNVVICDQAGSHPVPDADELTYAVGPEGGWAPDEVPPVWPVMSLGDSVLRVETAAVAAAVLLLHRL
jgi:16S rRNA (uracil1498-N3)-methyltransferase